VGAVGEGSLSSSGLEDYLDDLNIQHIMLNIDLESQQLAGTMVDKQLVREWREYLNHKLPTSLLVPGVAPQYADGPLGWRQWFEDNTGSAIAMRVRTDGLTREGKEYQGKLREFHERFVAAGGKPSRKAPRKPSVAELPGPIAPVLTARDVREAAKQAGELAADVAKGAAEGAGITPGKIIAAVAAAAAIAAAVLLGGRSR